MSTLAQPCCSGNAVLLPTTTRSLLLLRHQQPVGHGHCAHHLAPTCSRSCRALSRSARSSVSCSRVLLSSLLRCSSCTFRSSTSALSLSPSLWWLSHHICACCRRSASSCRVTVPAQTSHWNVHFVALEICLVLNHVAAHSEVLHFWLGER